MPRPTRQPQPTALEIQRRWFGRALLGVFWLAFMWFLSPGLPVFFGPWATAATRQAGQELFEHEWIPGDPLASGDGLGPVFNAKSCVACHFQGGVGGAGDNAHNIRNFTIVPNKRDPNFVDGTIHHFATSPELRESLPQIRQRFPIIKGQTQVRNEGHCTYTVTIPDFDPVRQSIVQTTALFGAGWIDRISAKSITHSLMNQAVENVAKEFNLDFSSIPAGQIRILPGGRIGKFGWKAQFATLEEFVAAACANELGLGTPTTEQAKPFGAPGSEKTPKPDLSRKQFSALLAFVDTLPRPVEIAPADSLEAERARHGKELFSRIGCAVCHIPDIGGLKGVYSDFLLHRIEDAGNRGSGYDDPANDQPLPNDRPRDSDWKTPPLWGVADSAPYLHDGSAPTLRDAITRHRADAKTVTDRFLKLNRDDQNALIGFLQTLRAPVDAVQAIRK